MSFATSNIAGGVLPPLPVETVREPRLRPAEQDARHNGARQQQQGLNADARREPQPPRVGFGDGTISGPTAAFRTLRRGLDEAGKLVPTVEESQARVRARLAEIRENLEPEQTTEPVSFDLQRQKAVAPTEQQFNTFIDRVNETTPTTETRPTDESAAPPAQRLDVQASDNIPTFLRAVEGNRLDLRG